MNITRLFGIGTVLMASPWVLAQDPNITEQPANVTVSVGATAQFSADAATANPPLTWQWWFKESAIDTSANPSAATEILSLTNVTLAQDGSYFAVVANASSGSATSQVATLTVDPTFTKITSGPVVTHSGAWQLPNWWDYDNDGFPDLYVPSSIGDVRYRDAVYHNNGGGTFSAVTNAINLQLADSTFGAVGDYNNDGLDDLLVAHWTTPLCLFRNDGNGNFTRMGGALVGRLVTDPVDTCDAGWADYDLDGFIDVFVANVDADNKEDRLYRNDGDGTFTRMTVNQVGGLLIVQDRTTPFTWVDYDDDGYPDLWVGAHFSGTGRQYLWHNDRNGKFSRVTGDSLGSLDQNIATSAGKWADYDNDGYVDLYLTSFGGADSLHRNVGGQTFTDVTEAAGILPVANTWMAAWGDYDNDGHLDLFVGAWYASVNCVLYHNNGDGTFASVDVGGPIRDDSGTAHCGTAWADYNNDGFLDLLITGWSNDATAKNLLYKNNGNGNGWLKIKLVGQASNRSAIGAKVRVQATIGGRTMWQMREISGNSGASGGAGGLVAHFGLGDAATADLVRIEWPSGIVQELTSVPARQFLTVTEHQAEADPTTSPSLAASKSAEGQVELSVQGQSNLLCVFEASTNLADWTKIAVRTNLTGTLTFTPPTSSAPRQFYRVLIP